MMRLLLVITSLLCLIFEPTCLLLLGMAVMREEEEVLVTHTINQTMMQLLSDASLRPRQTLWSKAHQYIDLQRHLLTRTGKSSPPEPRTKKIML